MRDGFANGSRKLRPQATGAAVDARRARGAHSRRSSRAGARAGVGAVPTRLGGSAPAAGPPPESLTGAGAALASVMNLLQGADVRPTTVQLNAIAARARRRRGRWRDGGGEDDRPAGVERAVDRGRSTGGQAVSGDT